MVLIDIVIRRSTHVEAMLEEVTRTPSQRPLSLIRDNAALCLSQLQNRRIGFRRLLPTISAWETHNQHIDMDAIIYLLLLFTHSIKIKKCNHEFVATALYVSCMHLIAIVRP